jgi:hypothetical protein
MDKQVRSRFEQALQRYADVIKERDAALLREKTARQQFEASFRAAVDNVILPAAVQVKELVAPEKWICLATKSDNGLLAKVEIYQEDMKATTGERPHIKILAALKTNSVQISMVSRSSGGSNQSTMRVDEITELIVPEHLLVLMEKLVAEGPPRWRTPLAGFPPVFAAAASIPLPRSRARLCLSVHRHAKWRNEL